MGRHGHRSGLQRGWRTLLLTTVSALAASVLLLVVSGGSSSVAVSAASIEFEGGGAAPLQRHVQPEDVIVAGGIDGRVYAIHAWTGDVLWMFDSGGPMVDSSNCGIPDAPASTSSATTSASTAVRPQHIQPDDSRHREPWRTTTLAADGSVDDGTGHSVTGKRGYGPDDAVAASASAALMSQMVPSYDGRLYHIAGSSVRELEMTMVDIINANGPVRLSGLGARSNRDVQTNDDDDDDNQDRADPRSDILLFGEKQTKIFSLDAAQGVIQPFLAPRRAMPGFGVDAHGSSHASGARILFGRAEFKTRAVHAANMSAARCFTISEYFLNFAHAPKCSLKDDAQLPQHVPEILVLPKDPDATNPDDEESTIAAYDPWTNEQLWELQIPRFDVIAVFGISAQRGATFYQWSIDGPSSTATLQKKELVHVAKNPTQPTKSDTSTATPQPAIGQAAAEVIDTNESKSGQLTKTVPRDWSAMESRFRLRILGGNYYLEPNEDDMSNLSGSGASSSFYDEDEAAEFRDRRMKRKRRVFWESMENNGKKGVFITYYHVGAMMFSVMVGCALIAWGFYVKGLSASLAQSAIKSIDSQFMMSHVHHLTIEQPGRETITISSVIGRSLLMNTAASLGPVDRSLPMLENGDEFGSAITTPTVRVDRETEAATLERYSRMAALEAAAHVTGATFANNTMQLEYDPVSPNPSTVSTSKSTLTLLPPTSSAFIRRKAMLEDEARTNRTEYDLPTLSADLTEDNEGRVVPVIEELDDSISSDASSEERASSVMATAERDAEVELNTTSSVQSGDKSDASWVSDTTGSSDRSSGGSESDSEGSQNSNELEDTALGSGGATETSNPRKVSNASSSSSSTPNDAEVLFPFVCQSRFANEFEELSALGKGGFGQVMLAENRLDGRKYAIKRVGLHLKNQTSKTLQKFLREVKILALLDHPNIVRYYQAWLEKVEEGSKNDFAAFGASSVSASGPPRNYSMSNLLAPISEMEYSDQRKSVDFYSSGSIGDDDGGFDWERNSSDGSAFDHAWREEDLKGPTRARQHERKPGPNGRRIGDLTNSRGEAGDAAEDEDSSCYSIDRCDHWLYIQMQYCAGRNLGDYLAVPSRPLELSRLMKIFTQIASAIAHVHSCGLIHRDLKPANIFVADTDGDSIKLGDFGLSRYAANVNLATQVVEEHSISNVLMNGQMLSTSKWSVSISNMSESQEITGGVGTYLYASPEQVAGKKYNAKTDMYSLGMILFELCHERFTTTMERYIALRNARERNFPPDFPWRQKCPDIMEMLDRLLHRDAMSRPDAAEVVQWSQELYEMSLAHLASSTMMRSPVLHPRSFSGSLSSGSSIDLDPLPGPTSAFSLQVEARPDSTSDENGERRLPNHNLLKEICDVIAEVSGGRMEIKKCGLHLQDGGAQILDFVLDPHLTEGELSTLSTGLEARQTLIKTIQALPGVHTVRMGM